MTHFETWCEILKESWHDLTGETSEERRERHDEERQAKIDRDLGNQQEGDGAELE